MTRGAVQAEVARVTPGSLGQRRKALCSGKSGTEPVGSKTGGRRSPYPDLRKQYVGPQVIPGYGRGQWGHWELEVGTRI